LRAALKDKVRDFLSLSRENLAKDYVNYKAETTAIGWGSMLRKPNPKAAVFPLKSADGNGYA